MLKIYYLGIAVYIIGIILISMKMMRDERLEKYRETPKTTMGILKGSIGLALVGLCPGIHWYIGLMLTWAWVDNDFYEIITEDSFKPWM